MAQPSIFARVKKPVHTAFLKACEDERRTMTAQIEIIIIDWLARREVAKVNGFKEPQ